MEHGSATPDSTRYGAGHSYPGDLARFVRERWNDTDGESAGAAPALLPDAEVLEELLSACYQASLLQEEERAVTRALDLEGEEVVEESVGEVGTRHRSAYRLIHALPEVLAVVVSQDGGVRFVTSRNGRVTYWEQE